MRKNITYRELLTIMEAPPDFRALEKLTNKQLRQLENTYKCINKLKPSPPNKSLTSPS